MNTYHLNLVCPSCPCPLTGAQLPELRQNIIVQAPNLKKARSLVPVVMTIRPRGQRLMIFHAGVLLVGDF